MNLLGINIAGVLAATVVGMAWHWVPYGIRQFFLAKNGCKA